jgi:acetyl-CoA carboxylase biotin carboxylase subunit
MISKFAVHGRDRREAIDRMRRALREYEIGGIKTTLSFFLRVMEDEEFVAGNLDTGFIGRFNERHTPVHPTQAESDIAVIAAALAYRDKAAVPGTVRQPDGPSRWVRAGRAAFHQR